MDHKLALFMAARVQARVCPLSKIQGSTMAELGFAALVSLAQDGMRIRFGGPPIEECFELVAKHAFGLEALVGAAISFYTSEGYTVTESRADPLPNTHTLTLCGDEVTFDTIIRLGDTVHSPYTAYIEESLTT